jgi:hypothetical protein
VSEPTVSVVMADSNSLWPRRFGPAPGIDQQAASTIDATPMAPARRTARQDVVWMLVFSPA